MDSGELKTVCILRRMKRKQLNSLSFTPYHPSRALPEELRFDLLDENDRNTGSFTYGRIRVLSGLDISTPWGPARMDWLKGGVRISLNAKELVFLKTAILKRMGSFSFPSGVTMEFHSPKKRKNDIEYSDGKGSVSVQQEEGTLPEGHPSLRIQMTKEEIKRLPKKDRPHSTESRDYVQWRVMMGGILPVSQESMVAVLTILCGYVRLMDEGIEQL